MARRPRASDDPDLSMGMRPSAYTQDDEITGVARELMTKYPESLGFLAGFRLIFLWRHSERTDVEFHPATAAGVFIRTDRERAIRADIDAGAWFHGTFWNRFSPDQRRAWVHSMLLRFGMTAKGALVMLRPDVVEWAAVVRIYGPWVDQLQLFAEGIDAHAHPAPEPAAIARRRSAQTTTSPVN